jgi:acyl-CoA synthetase (AMP-forming)/AMP-acid ligase II
MNIVEPILFQARYRPEAVALCAPGNDVVSYAQLVLQMNAIAGRAIALGLRPASVVALSIEEPLLHAAVILGLAQVGIVTVSVARHKPPPGLKVDAVISSGRPYPYAPEARHLTLDFSWMTIGGAAVATSPAGSYASKEICRIALTAGTTGDPKAVALTHEMVMARNARFDHAMGSRLATCLRVYMNMGLAAALGYQFLIHILSRGGTLFFRGESLENTLRSFEIFRIDAMLATPTTLAQLLMLCDRAAIEVHVDTILSGGSLLPRSLVERVRPRLCQHLITGYGATETAISATAPADRIAHIAGAAGYVTPGIRLEIVDEADRPLPAGAEGIVRVASEFAVDRYIDDPIESAKVFRDGWFYPGDLGSLTPDNLLIISGRQNDVLNAGGGKLSAEKVEAVLLACKGVSEAAVFMATNKLGVEEVWAAIVCSEKIDAEAMRALCRSSMPTVFVPVHIVTVEALPLSAVGKVDRRLLKDRLTGEP